MCDRDVQILRFFAATSVPLPQQGTPFEPAEIANLVKGGFLVPKDQYVPATEDESACTVTVFCLTQKGKNELAEAKKQKRKDRRDFLTFVLTAVSVALTVATLIVSILSLLQG